MIRTLSHDGLTFRLSDSEAGLPVVFQHGLGGDLTIPTALFPPPDGVRVLSFDARYHGETRPLGDPEKLSFRAFADDLLAILDHLGIQRAVVGGISMGAGLALNFATRYPDRTIGLVLSRPAWLDEPFPENVRAFPVMARLIRESGAVEGLARFRSTEEYRAIAAESADSANALIGMFTHPRAEETVEKLERIPRDCPCPDRSAWRSIRMPCLVMANRQDPIHPYETGLDLASEIPGASFGELTPKSVSLGRHADDVIRLMGEFLSTHFLD